jgi:ADP-heptose:LPS heptosyltransferase
VRPSEGIDAPGRVLIVRLTALGDVVLVTHLARALRASSPGLAVDLLTDARLVPLIEQLGGFDRVFGWDRRGADAGLRGVWAVRRRVLAAGGTYRAVLDLQGKLRTRALVRLLPAGARGTLQKRTLGGVLRALMGRDRPIVDRHTLELYRGVAEAAALPTGARALGAGPHVAREGAAAPGVGPVSPLPGRTAERVLRTVGLGIGTTHQTKRWPHFAGLVGALGRSHPGIRFVLIGGPADHTELERLRSDVDPKVLDPRDAAALDPVGLLGLLRELDVLVTVDSGAAHIAQGIGVPTLVLFGPTSPARWGPSAPPHRALSLGLACSPCSNVGGARCPIEARAHACLRELDPEQVAREALLVWEAAR